MYVYPNLECVRTVVQQCTIVAVGTSTFMATRSSDGQTAVGMLCSAILQSWLCTFMTTRSYDGQTSAGGVWAVSGQPTASVDLGHPSRGSHLHTASTQRPSLTAGKAPSTFSQLLTSFPHSRWSTIYIQPALNVLPSHQVKHHLHSAST